MEKRSLGSRLVSNTFFISIEWFVVTLLSMLFWLVIGKILAPSDYGIVSIFTNMTVVIGTLIPLGTSLALFKLIPEHIQKKELGKITSSIRFTLKLILIVWIIASTLILIFSNQISSYIKIPIELVYILPISIIFFSIATHQGQIILGFQRAEISAITASIAQVVETGLSTIMIFLQFRFIGPVMAFISSSVLLFLTRIKFLNYTHKPENIDEKELVLKYGLPSFLAKISNLLLLSGSAVVLALFQTSTVVGIFSLAMLMTSQLSIIPNIFSSALFPITSLLSIDKDSGKRQSRLINLIFRYSLLVTLPLVTFIILFSSQLIVLVSQSSYLSAASLIPLLSIGALFLGISYIFTNSLYAIGRPDIQRNLIMTTSLVYIILAFPMAYFFSSIGVATAYMVSAIVLFSSSFVYLKHTLRFRMPWLSTGKLVASNIISFGILYILSKYASSIWVGMLYTAITGILYLILLLLLKFYTQDDVNLINRISVHLPIGKKHAKYIATLLSKFSEG